MTNDEYEGEVVDLEPYEGKPDFDGPQHEGDVQEDEANDEYEPPTAAPVVEGEVHGGQETGPVTPTEDQS